MIEKPVTHKRVESYLKECLRWFGMGHLDYGLETINDAILPDDQDRVAFYRKTSAAAGLFRVAIARPWLDVKRSVIHECLHAVLEEMRTTFCIMESKMAETGRALGEVYDEQQERAVLRLERAMMGALQDD